jgi:hypothetical protein
MKINGRVPILHFRCFVQIIDVNDRNIAIRTFSPNRNADTGTIESDKTMAAGGSVTGKIALALRNALGANACDFVP